MSNTKLDEIITEFADLEPRERLELLADFADGLPGLPPHYQAQRDAGEHRVHECQTPVFLWVEVAEGRVRVYADVAPEAPTVKGFVAVLVDACWDAPVEDVLAIPQDLLQRIGLIQALGMTRMRGLYAILGRIRQEVRTVADIASAVP